jgi:hypothetical protein
MKAKMVKILLLKTVLMATGASISHATVELVTGDSNPVVQKTLSRAVQSRPPGLPRTAPPGIPVVTGYSGYFLGDKCTNPIPAIWQVTKPPTYGVTEYSVVWGTGTGACEGVPLSYGVMYYTWTSTDPAATKDFLEIKDISNNNIGLPIINAFNIKRPRIIINNVDLSTGIADIVLDAHGDVGFGKLTLTFTADDDNSVKLEYPVPFPAGERKLPIERTKLTKDVYKYADIKWSPFAYTIPPTNFDLKQEYTPDKPWNVQGKTRYTQYNIPHESRCSAAETSAWIVDSPNTCNFSQSTLRQKFFDETNENGSGLSILHSYVSSGQSTNI